MLAYGIDILTYLYLAALLASAAVLLSQKKPKLASLDDAVQSSATQGQFIPLVIGRARVGPVFCFVEDAFASLAMVTPQSRNMSPGGAAVGTQGQFAKGGGSAPSQPSYFENALHILCIGPGSKLHSITQNGEVIWSGPIDPASHPSGSLLPAGNSGGSEGFFEVHWGFPDDPILTELQNSPLHGLPVRYSHVMKIMWKSKNLGPTRQWPRLEYEITCPCYSQITSSASEIPLEGDDLRPIFSDWKDSDAYLPIPFPGGPAPALPTARIEFQVMSYDAAMRQVYVADSRLFSVSGDPDQANTLVRLFPSGGIVKIWTNSSGGAVTLGGQNVNDAPQNPVSTRSNLNLLSAPGQWRYFWVIKSERFPNRWWRPTNFNSDYPVILTLGPEVDALSLKNQQTGNHAETLAPGWQPLGWVQPVDISNSDGVNAIHMIDQLLFAKYPYGGGKDRSKFDARSIEYTAEQMQKEKIRSTITIKDGEGLRSSLSGIMQDIGLFIVWDAQVGKHVFNLIRYEEATVNLPPEAILELPEAVGVMGSRPADVLAFTFKDRQRNYREAPLKLFDSGQVQEYQSQRAKKIPIEVTNDRDSVVRMLPRRQQEVLANLEAIKFVANHAAVLATPGVRFTAIGTEEEGMQFLLTEVLRDINSGKTILTTTLDTYNPPLETPSSMMALVSDERMLAPPNVRAPADPVESFAAFEMPRALSRGSVEVLFLASRNTEKTASSVIWGSRDASQYSILGNSPIVVSGVLAEDLPAGPHYDEGDHAVDFEDNVDPNSIEDLSIDPASWQAGKQIMIIGSEVIFLREAFFGHDSTITGLIRGRAGTISALHSEGTRFYVLPASYVIPLTSSLFVPGKTTYFKAQAHSRNKASDLDAVSPQSIAIVGKAFVPPPVVALRIVGRP